MTTSSLPEQPSRFSRVLSAMRRPNVLGVTVGGGIVGAMLLKHLFGAQYEITGALMGLALALFFVTKDNLSRMSRN
jgi:ABC-type phosphate/phosphonate transport system permease subunit